MFSWLVSLLLLLNFGGRASSVPLTGPSDYGNRRVTPAQDSHPHHAEPADEDGSSSAAEEVVEQSLHQDASGSCPENVSQLRLIRAQILSLRGHADAALAYLESSCSPEPDDLESQIELKRLRGVCSGSLGKYEASHRLIGEAESLARSARLTRLVGEALLSRAFVFFLQKDYVSSDRLFREVFELARERDGGQLRGHALWGIGKNLMI